MSMLEQAQAYRAIQTFQAAQAVIVIKARARIPEAFRNAGFYGLTDVWHYFAMSSTPGGPSNTCAICASFNGEDIIGAELRSIDDFKFHVIIDQDTIDPQVHPNCKCLMVRNKQREAELEAELAVEQVHLKPEQEPRGRLPVIPEESLRDRLRRLIRESNEKLERT